MQLTTKSCLALTVAIIAHLGHFHLSIPVKEKNVVVWQRGHLGLKWAKNAAARYPSTVDCGRYSLLCEASLTHCPPL
jgi:hypothetical protein